MLSDEQITQLREDEMSSIESGLAKIGTWSSLYVNCALDTAWQITCPCGVTVKYALNELPMTDTPHPCGDPTHWTVKIASLPAAQQRVEKSDE